jgi:hypothetical protein
MIESEEQLRHSVKVLARMYTLCDCISAQTIGDPDTRADEIEGVGSAIRKIELEIAEYLAKKYELRRVEVETEG